MILYFSVNACNACRESERLYKQVHDYMRSKGRLDFKAVSLTTTGALQEYNEKVKPYRAGRDSLPMVFDTETKQELIFDEQGKIRRRKVLQRNQQEAEEPSIPRRRPGNTEEAEPDNAEELAQKG